MSVCIIDFDTQDRSQNTAFEDVSSLSSNLLYISDDSWQPGSPVARKSEGRRMLDETLVTHCMGCSRPFDIVVSKHHCRGCGQVFCSSCASFKVAMEGYADRQRACLTCVSKIVTKAKRSSFSPPASPIAPRSPSEAAIHAELPDWHDDTPWSPEAVVRAGIKSSSNQIAKNNKPTFIPKIRRGEPPKRIFQASTGFILGKAIDAAALRETKEAKTPVKVYDENENVTTIRFGSGSFDRKMSVLKDMTNRGISNSSKEDNKASVQKHSLISKEHQRETSFDSSRLESLMDGQGKLLMSPADQSRGYDEDSMDFLVDEENYPNAENEAGSMNISPMSSPIFAKMSQNSTDKLALKYLQSNDDDECAVSSDTDDHRNYNQGECSVADGSFDQSVVFESLIQEEDASPDQRNGYNLSSTSLDPSPMAIPFSKFGWVLGISIAFILFVFVPHLHSDRILRWDARFLSSTAPMIYTTDLDVQQERNLAIEISEMNQRDSFGLEIHNTPKVAEEEAQVGNMSGDVMMQLDGESKQSSTNDFSLTPAENSFVYQETKRFPHKISWVGALTRMSSKRRDQQELLSNVNATLSSPLAQSNFAKEIVVMEKFEATNEEVPVLSSRALVLLDMSKYNTNYKKGMRLSDLYRSASRRIIYNIHPPLIASLAGALIRKLGALMRTTISFFFRKVYMLINREGGALTL